MESGTVHCGVILIYIRGLHPSVNQGTTSICYLNDKQKPEHREGPQKRRKRWTNQFRFQSGKDTRPPAITLMKNGSSTSPHRHNGWYSVPPSMEGSHCSSASNRGPNKNTDTKSNDVLPSAIISSNILGSFDFRGIMKKCINERKSLGPGSSCNLASLWLYFVWMAK